jgi:hypothetical protein
MSGLIAGLKHCLPIEFREEGASVIYKGVEFSVMATAEPDIWEWRYEMAGRVKTGKTHTRLVALAIRRVETKIDAALRAAKSAAGNQPN